MNWLVAGLGNPGDRYGRTRHNVGAMVAEELARATGDRFRKARFLPIDVAETHVGDHRVLVAKSQRFMNEAGPSYASLARKNDVDVARVIAVHDDLDLAAGALRVKSGGSTAGHNGLRSLQQALRSPDFLRVRIGIGRPPGRQDPADFVVEPLPKRQEAEVARLVDDAADAVRTLIVEGLERTQDRFNRPGPRT
ncbi:MAG: aminoacyl-tRNA hydrolase [Actinomycetota bacterium]